MSRTRGSGIRGVSIERVGREQYRVYVAVGPRGANRRVNFRISGSYEQALDAGRARRDEILGLSADAAEIGKLELATYFRERFVPSKQRADRRTRTIETLEDTFRVYVEPQLGRITIAQLVADEGAGVAIVDRWLSWLASSEAVSKRARARGTQKLSPRSRQKAVRCLSGILRHAIRGRRRWSNPLEAFVDELPAPDYTKAGARRAQPLEVALGILRAFDGHELEAAVYLGLGCGLRRGEVLGLSLSAIRDLDGSSPEVEIRQTAVAVRGGVRLEQAAKTRGSLRRVSLPAFVAERVKRQLLRVELLRLEAGELYAAPAGGDLLFPRSGLRGYGARSSCGGPMYPATLSRVFKQRLLEVGLGDLDFDGLAGLRLHDLRHTHITLGIELGGLPLEVVGRHAGHVRSETTQGYFDPTREAEKKIARAFDKILGGSR